VDIIFSICLGIGLSAACGFRVFVPLLVASIASISGYLNLSSGFQWIGTSTALIAFATATILEIIAYYVPWVDNIMDTIAAPAAAVAGTVVAASSFVDMSPFMKWTLAIIAGGGTASILHGSTALLRAASSAGTLGLGNHAVATTELLMATGLSVLAIALPLAGVVVVIAILFIIARKGVKKLCKA